MAVREVEVEGRTPAVSTTRSRLRLMLAVAVALVGCRIVSAWYSVEAMLVALAILALLAAGFVWARPRLCRVLLLLVLPFVALADAAVLAVAGFTAFMAARGLLPAEQTPQAGPAGAAYFALTAAAAAHLIAVARPASLARRRQLALAGVSSLLLAVYGLWQWHIHDSSTLFGLQPPRETLTLFAWAGLLFLVVLADRPTRGVDPQAGGSAPIARRRPWRAGLVAVVGLAVCVPFWTALVPVVQQRSLVCSLEKLGFDVMCKPGTRRLWPAFFEPGLHGYTAEPALLTADELGADDIVAAERLFTRTPELEQLAITRFPAGGERMLRMFAGSASLQTLRLGGPEVTDATLAEIANIPSLEAVELPDSRISDRGLRQLSGCTWLLGLDLHGASITGDGLAQLNPLTRLGLLDLSATSIGDDELAKLQGLRALGMLRLRDTRVGDAGLKHLAQMARLWELDLSGTQISDEGMKQVAVLRLLVVLKLADTRLSDVGLRSLKDCAALAWIDLSRTRITDAALNELPAFQSLRTIGLNGTNITDAGLERLAELPMLCELELADTQVTDEGLAHLVRLRNLSRIDLRNTNVTRAGVEQLRQAFPNCRVQWAETPAGR